VDVSVTTAVPLQALKLITNAVNARPKPNTRKYMNDPLTATGGHSSSNREVKEASKK
jgi:hypothetical protein